MPAPRRLAPLAPVLLPLILLIGTAWAGADFGTHWDEHFHTEAVERTLQTGVPLPRWYIYPSMTYWLTLSGTAPRYLRELPGEKTRAQIRHDLLPLVRSEGYLVGVRKLFAVVSGAVVLWAYLLVFLWRKRPLEALFAAGLLATSFELGYHARWVAPDCIHTSFGALSVLCAAAALARRQGPAARPWLDLSALAAGLACGSKYPGGLFLLPVYTAVLACAIPAWQARRGEPLRRRLVDLAALLLTPGLVFALTFVLTTPGSVLDTEDFLDTVQTMVGYYQRGHYGHTVEAGWDHFLRNLRYLTTVLLSPYPALAAPLSFLSVLGAAAVLRESRWLAALLLGFPLVYLPYWSQQRVMVVRNLLVLAPFLAVLAARGAGWVHDTVAAGLVHTPLFRIWRVLWPVALGAALCLDGAYLVDAARSVRARRSDAGVRALSRYLDAHPRERFFATARVTAALARLGGPPHPNLVPRPARATGVLLYASEGMNHNAWPANTPGLAARTFGPREVNFDYYPSWIGNDRILLMTVPLARELKIRPLRPYMATIVE